MKKRLCLTVGCISALLAASGAQAQVTTLDYQGSLMSGTTQTGNPPNTPFTYTPFSDSFTAKLVVDGSLSAGNETLVSYQISLANNGLVFSGGFSKPEVGTYYLTTPGYIELTTANGMFTGAQINIFTFPHAASQAVSILPTGDSYFSTTGGLDPNPSQIHASNAIAGVWTVTTLTSAKAPEIDPASTPAAIAMLLAGLAVIRGRRTGR